MVSASNGDDEKEGEARQGARPQVPPKRDGARERVKRRANVGHARDVEGIRIEICTTVYNKE
jgi:hypothetical protein